MKIQTLNNQNVAHKAYFKPNGNFKKLYGHQTLVNRCDETLLSRFKSLPNHELEIVDIISLDKNLSYGEFSCTVVNNSTHKALNFFVEKTSEKLDRLLKQLINTNNFWISEFYEKDDKVNDDYLNLIKPHKR